MFDIIINTAIILATISAGLMAGVYFAFSAFIMRSLDQLGAMRATEAMNAINEVILRSWFMALFFASTLLYTALLVYGLLKPELAGRWWLVAAGSIYVVGMFISTAAFNVPLNNRLAAVNDDYASPQELWPVYFNYWTRWNHARAVCSTLSCLLSICFLIEHG